MSLEKELQETSGGIDKTNQWVTTIRNLAKQAGCEKAIEPMLFKKLRETINVALIGGQNSGKSSRINSLVERKVIPVSSLASNFSFSVQSIHGDEDEHFNTNDISGSLSDLTNALESDTRNVKEYQVYINSNWLNENLIKLIEKPALDAIDEELDTLFEECLNSVDLVILLIDALMPVKRSELKFMNVCLNRKLPFVIALSRSDKLSDSEREDVESYVIKHVESCGSRIPVINTCITPTFTSGIDELKQAIKQCLNDVDLNAIRKAEAHHALQIAINIMISAIQHGVAEQSKKRAELDYEVNQRQQQIETMSLEWVKIEQAMNEKRQKIDDLIRNALEENKNTILEKLLYQLERNKDIKAWWEVDFPFFIKGELKALEKGLSASINKNVSNDIKWLREESFRSLKLSLNDLKESVVSIEKFELIQKKFALSDSHRFTIISRLGTATSVILAGTFLTIAGGGGIVMATSVIAGLTVEQIARFNMRKDRDIIRNEIQKTIQQAIHEYAKGVSLKLKEGYDEVILNFKQHQELWLQDSLESLKTHAQKSAVHGGFDWQKLLDETNQLNDEIKANS